MYVSKQKFRIAAIYLLSGVSASEITYSMSGVALTSVHSLNPKSKCFAGFDYREKWAIHQNRDPPPLAEQFNPCVVADQLITPRPFLISLNCHQQQHRLSESSHCCWVGGLAQWLGRQSLAGGLSLIYAWSMADMWPLRG